MPVTYAQPLVVKAADSAKHTATVIFAHGLGDSGHGWAPVVENLRRRQLLDEVKFVLPHAPTAPVTANGGFPMPSWYDIKQFGAGIAATASDPRLTVSEDVAGLLASRAYLRRLIEAETTQHGIPASRIVIGGFSQGGAIALLTGATQPPADRLAGILALSTYLPLSSRLESLLEESAAASSTDADRIKQTPIFTGHGTADPVVPIALSRLSRDKLQTAGFAKIEVKEYSGMAHSSCPEEIDDVARFLQKVLPPRGNDKL